jgi:sugar phosphate isomerase/epimerase
MSHPFTLCFNTSTIRAAKLPLLKIIPLVAGAGFRAIEPWIAELDAHVQAGGTLADIRKACADAGLKVASAIGFFEWIVEDDALRRKGFAEAKRNFEQMQAIGATNLAAPAFGAHMPLKPGETPVDLRRAAERYHELCTLGAQYGVAPMVEVWGGSRTLSRLGEAAFVAIESGHANACLLADVYHLYKGGSPTAGLQMLQGRRLPVFHMNDLPAGFPRATVDDADRVYPGDGILPLQETIATLKQIGATSYLSVELFNQTYYAQPPATVVKTAYEKLATVVQAA